MPVILEESDVLGFLRILKSLFGVPVRDDAAAHEQTQALIRTLTTITETKMTQAADDIAQLQGDVAALSGAFTSFQAKVQADAQAAAQKAADLQTQLDAAKAALAGAGTTVPAEVQSAIDAAHTASQALVTQINALSTSAASPTAPAEGTQPTPAPTPEPTPTPTPAPAPVDPNAPQGTELPSQPQA